MGSIQYFMSEEELEMLWIRKYLLTLLPALMLQGVDLKPGQPAPAFSAVDQNGKSVSLSDFTDRFKVALYFYPKDNTPGCTAEACSLRDGYSQIIEAGAVVLGVSADDTKSHANFANKYKLPFSILADPERKIIQSYGVKMPVVGLAKRVTYLIDRKGIIRHIITDVKTTEHDKQILKLLNGM